MTESSARSAGSERVVRIALVRHGRALAGWDTAVDPGLDQLGYSQASAAATKLENIFAGQEVEIVSSPLLRCRQTAQVFADKRKTADKAEIQVQVSQDVAEIPSPEGVSMAERVEWLRTAMQGTWADLGGEYVTFRDRVVGFVRSLQVDTVIFSHFIAINAVIGSLTNDDRLVIRSLDNCSITLLELDSSGALNIAQSGHEADTLIR